jgi:phosphoglycolate phosphatase
MNRALAAHGLPERPLEELHALIGPPPSVSFSGLLGVSPQDPEVADLVERYRGFYREVALEETELVPGIAEVVAELAAFRRLAVATSKAKALAEPILDALGLLEHFAVVAGPELGALDEDKTTTAARALAQLGVDTAPLVGDTRFDIEAARALGIQAIGVTWGIGTEAALREAGADVIVDDPRELLDLLRA